MPAKSLPSRPSLNHLKYQAKDLLNAFRAAESAALVRIQRFHPKFAGRSLADLRALPFTLSEAQVVVAREYGFESWPKLKQQVEKLRGTAKELPAASDTALAAESQDALAARFLEYACPDHHVRGGPAQIMARHTAVQLLEQHPELARHSLYTAVVCGELDEVRRILSENPPAASEPYAGTGPDRSGLGHSEDLFKENGPKRWEPLLYLCFARLDTAAATTHALPIARLLLDHGASSNAYFMAGDSRYTPLVGVCGEGEENRPPHPHREALVQLLLERGAEPFDMQVVYDLHFRGEILWFMRLIHASSVKAGRGRDWQDPDWSMLNMGRYGSGARWHLEIALKKNDLELARWLLEHGANPNAAPAQDPRFLQGALVDEAANHGLTAMAHLLTQYGAESRGTPRPGQAQFMAACFRLDQAEAARLASENPAYLQSTDALFAAAHQDRAEVVALLLHLGMSPEMADAHRQRALHVAAYQDSIAVAKLLVERGAAVDPLDGMHQATPLWWAVWGQRPRTIAFLSQSSRDLKALAFTGNIARIRELLRNEPDLAKQAAPQSSPLLWLPGEPRNAAAIAELLLSHGADPTPRNAEGLTAAEVAEKRGLDQAAAILKGPLAGPPSPPPPASFAPAPLQELANDYVRVYDTGEPQALQRLNAHYRRSFTWDDARAHVWRQVYKVRRGQGRPGSFAVEDAQWLMARETGFSNWGALLQAATAGTMPPGDCYVLDLKRSWIQPRRHLAPPDWDTILAVMREHRVTALDADGHMTDDALKKVAELGQVTRLNLGGSRQLTDDGLQHLALMPQLEHLDLSEYPGGRLTDRGLAVLRHLPTLKTFQIAWQSAISDRGMAQLASCPQLEVVNLMGTPTGDGAIRALVGKAKLREFNTGRLVTDEGLPLLHQFPVFKTWQGAEVDYGRFSPNDKPNHLTIDGPFSDEGLANLAGLDGLFGLTFFWHTSALTPAGLNVLQHLPRLGAIGCEGKLCNDTAMRSIAAVPRLTMLMAQGTVATDAGFEALSHSPTLQRLWTRENPQLTSRGFLALSQMPALRFLGVSCKEVNDEALARLPHFPALRQLTPIDVRDPGFRHIGRCEYLETLTCMYCRDTTDAATEHLASLTRLKSYYAGLTQITDRSLELLSQIASLEEIEFYECSSITDAGLVFLAGLPRLRKVELAGLPNVTLAGTKVFPARVEVRYAL
ncbi:MAG: hypothetical protein U1G07_07700 [Verrucomicrobiota bacterium]